MYYAEKLSGKRLQHINEIVPERVRRYLEVEIAFALGDFRSKFKNPHENRTVGIPAESGHPFRDDFGRRTPVEQGALSRFRHGLDE